MGKGEKGGFGFSSGYRSHVHVHVTPVYYGRYGRRYGYGSYAASTGDCVCGCGPLHFLVLLAIVWLILMMCLTFSTAPKARYSEDVYLEMTETRPYYLPSKKSFTSSKTDLNDKIGNTKFYQFESGNLPALTGPVQSQAPTIPNRVVPNDDWRWEGYWVNPGSTAVYSASCTNNVDIVILEGDENLASWESIGANAGSSYAKYFDYGLTSITYNYPAASAGQNVYFLLANPYYSIATCSIKLNITYTTYNLNGRSPVLTGSGTLDANDGPVVMVPPRVTDSRNIYNGGDGFTIGADMYTINVKQQADPVAMAGPMMGIFGGVCVLFIICGCVMVNGLPECLGGHPDDGVGSSSPPGTAPAAAAAPGTTLAPVEMTTPPPLASAPSSDMNKPAYPAPAPVQPMQPIVVSAAPPLLMTQQSSGSSAPIQNMPVQYYNPNMPPQYYNPNAPPPAQPVVVVVQQQQPPPY